MSECSYGCRSPWELLKILSCLGTKQAEVWPQISIQFSHEITFLSFQRNPFPFHRARVRHGSRKEFLWVQVEESTALLFPDFCIFICRHQDSSSGWSFKSLFMFKERCKLSEQNSKISAEQDRVVYITFPVVQTLTPRGCTPVQKLVTKINIFLGLTAT